MVVMIGRGRWIRRIAATSARSTDRGAIPALCASCHSDLDKMRPYNIPVDQYAIYQTSQHGRALARGDTRAAVCTDCHGSHDMRPADDPRSSIHTRNVPATCGSCHSDAVLMSRYGHDSGVVDDYMGSVHGRALLVGRRRPTAPTVTASMAPRLRVSAMSTRSAAPVTRRPAVPLSTDRTMKRCVAAGLPSAPRATPTTPSSHRAREPSERSVPSAMATTRRRPTGRKMATLIRGGGESSTRPKSWSPKAERMALHVEDYLGRVEEARTYLTEALPLVHTVGSNRSKTSPGERSRSPKRSNTRSMPSWTAGPPVSVWCSSGSIFC